MSDIPREWQFRTAANNPQTASILVPAAQSGLRHVLTFVNYTIGIAAGTGAFFPGIEVRDGAAVKFGWNLFLNAPAGAIDHDSFVDDLLIIGSPGTDMLIQFTAACPAGGEELILARGYTF